MQIATWNVNSVRQRTEHLVRYLKEVGPDVLCLQELKCVDEAFPHMEVEACGYNVAVHGQKGFNGVAILSKTPIEVTRGLPGDDDDAHARYIEAIVPEGKGIVRVACLYLPNGNPARHGQIYAISSPGWTGCIAHAKRLLAYEEPLVLAGDYNVIPEPRDCYDPAAWMGDALFLPQTREKFRALVNLGFTDALRATSDAAGLYTFWDYQAGCWQRDKGIRIDHLLLSPYAADRLTHVAIDKERRGEDKPSDHVPIRVELA